MMQDSSSGHARSKSIGPQLIEKPNSGEALGSHPVKEKPIEPSLRCAWFDWPAWPLPDLVFRRTSRPGPGDEAHGTTSDLVPLRSTPDAFRLLPEMNASAGLVSISARSCPAEVNVPGLASGHFGSFVLQEVNSCDWHTNHSYRLAQINQMNRRFWSDRAEIVARQVADELLLRCATDRVSGEMLRGVPTRAQVTLEQALAETEDLGRKFVSKHARNGGRALKGDPLQRLIEEWVRRTPELTCSELLSRLRNHCPMFPIEEVSEEEITINLNRPGRVKSVQISGLKDRLSRAKKKLRSRKPAPAN